MKKLLIPTDFTDTAKGAQDCGVQLASLSGATIDLLHVVDQEFEMDAGSDAEANLTKAVNAVSERTSSAVQGGMVKGSIFEEIPAKAQSLNADLMIITTHGKQGLRQAFFGANILKVVNPTSIPSLVLPEGVSELRANAPIIMPVGGHPNQEHLLKAVANIADVLKAEVVLYEIDRAGNVPSDTLKANVEKARSYFDEHGIANRYHKEEGNTVSLGFAAQTSAFAASAGASCIAMMSGSSGEFSYLAKADKERLVLNEERIPVLVAGDIA